MIFLAEVSRTETDFLGPGVDFLFSLGSIPPPRSTAALVGVFRRDVLKVTVLEAVPLRIEGFFVVVLVLAARRFVRDVLGDMKVRLPGRARDTGLAVCWFQENKIDIKM